MRDLHAAVVTGPTGAIGTALCERLAGAGAQVYAVVRPDSPRAGHLRAIRGVALVECDAARFDRLPALVPHADAFFHLAWAKTVGQGRNDMEAQINNIRFTLEAARAASALGCSAFIGAGSQAEYGRAEVPLAPDTPCFPENGYGMAKLCAGQMSRAECQRLGLVHIWPRILSVYGPWDGPNAMIPRVIRALLAGERPALTPGTQLWDFLYADDAAEALCRMAASGRDGAVYPLGGGAARPLREYVEALRDAVDPALPLGFGEAPFGAGQVMRLEADLAALRADTGFVPRTDFQTGIRNTIEWVKRHE